MNGLSCTPLYRQPKYFDCTVGEIFIELLGAFQRSEFHGIYSAIHALIPFAVISLYLPSR